MAHRSSSRAPSNHPRGLRAFAALVAVASALAACAAGSRAVDTQGGAQQGDPIIAGQTATDYPEAVLVDLYQGGELYAMCSGSLVAPTVVLTAGHCVHDIDSWKVTAPFAKNQKATSSRSETYDWNASGEDVDPSEHDLGLVFLDTPIALDAYPKLATSALADGKSILNIGRIHDGTLSNTKLYVSPPVTITSGKASGFSFDYSATDEIEPGDSGGPDVLPGAAPHTIVAVNSGAGSGTEVLARVDLVRSWIEDRITGAKGPSGSGSASSSSSSSSSGSSGSSSSAACKHDVCALGERLTKKCDPCVAAICDVDESCCEHTWGATCIGQVASVCGTSCGGGGAGGSSSSSGNCGKIDAGGTCKGDDLEYCDGGSLAKVDCSTYGLACGWDADEGEYDCL